MKWRTVRWFTIEMRDGALGLRDIASQMLEEQYTSRRATGFALKASSDVRIEGVFAQRRELEETIEDPLGRTFTNRRVVVRQFRFRITKDYPQLEVVDAAAGFAAFFSRLTAMLNQRAIIEPVCVPPTDWLAAMEEASPAEITVSAVVVSAIPLTEAINARVVVQGEGDVRAVARKLVMRSPSVDEPSYDRVLLSWPSARHIVKCELGRRGARVETSSDDHARPVLRRALATIHNERQASALIVQADTLMRSTLPTARTRRQT